MNTSYLWAALLAFSAFTCWVGNDTFMKLSGESLSIAQRGLVNQFVSLLVICFYFLKSAGPRALRTRSPVFHLARGIVGFLCTLFILYAVSNLPLANYYTLAFTAPLMVALISAVTIKESLGVGVWLAILIGFGGVVIAVNPNHHDPATWPLLGVGSMLLSMFCFALYSASIRWGGKSETSAALAFYPEVFSSLAYVAWMIVTKDWSYNMEGFVYILLSGIVNGTGVICLTEAYKRAKSGLIAPFHYTQIIAGTLIGYLIWNHVPTLQTLLGMAVIVAAGLYIIWYGAQHETEDSHH